MNSSSYLSTSSYAYSTVPSNRTATNHINLSDRFKGALLGLTLTPLALSSMPGTTDLFSKSAVAKDMATAIQSGLSLNGHIHPWLSPLGMLLRYYDEVPEHRHKRLAIAAASTTTNSAATNNRAIAHQCFFSDVVSRALSGLPLTPSWLQSQQQSAAHTADHYAIADTHPIVVGAASLATCSSTHYSICVPIAALSNRSADRSAFTNVMPTDVSLNWEAALVAGLLTGAIGGRSSLPVLWQQLCGSRRWGEDLYQLADIAALAITLADTLFDQWTGRQMSS